MSVHEIAFKILSEQSKRIVYILTKSILRTISHPPLYKDSVAQWIKFIFLWLIEESNIILQLVSRGNGYKLQTFNLLKQSLKYNLFVSWRAFIHAYHIQKRPCSPIKDKKTYKAAFSEDWIGHLGFGDLKMDDFSCDIIKIWGWSQVSGFCLSLCPCSALGSCQLMQGRSPELNSHLNRPHIMLTLDFT